MEGMKGSDPKHGLAHKAETLVTLLGAEVFSKGFLTSELPALKWRHLPGIALGTLNEKKKTGWGRT